VNQIKERRQGPVEKSQEAAPIADATRDFCERDMLSFSLPAHGDGRGPLPESGHPAPGRGDPRRAPATDRSGRRPRDPKTAIGGWLAAPKIVDLAPVLDTPLAVIATNVFHRAVGVRATRGFPRGPLRCAAYVNGEPRERAAATATWPDGCFAAAGILSGVGERMAAGTGSSSARSCTILRSRPTMSSRKWPASAPSSSRS
jgi:hypothetical protein